MKHRIVMVVAAVVFAAIIAAFLAFGTRSTQREAALPVPNGYDDFTAAAQ